MDKTRDEKMRGHENTECLVKREPSRKPPSGWTGVDRPSRRTPLSNCTKWAKILQILEHPSTKDRTAEVTPRTSRVKIGEKKKV